MRADGASFLLKFPAAAGLTYHFSAVLHEDSAAAHIRLAVFPPDVIGTASSAGVASESSCQLPPAAASLRSKDVAEMALGTWRSAQHGQTWGEQHRGSRPPLTSRNSASETTVDVTTADMAVRTGGAVATSVATTLDTAVAGDVSSISTAGKLEVAAGSTTDLAV
eukprot:SAG31_NODE_10530_length_1127_cov_4.018482_1_plen_164_part_10